MFLGRGGVVEQQRKGLRATVDPELQDRNASPATNLESERAEWPGVWM